MSKFYVTTPIYYVNDAPHIGHAYTTILADVLARYHRAAGEEVFFLTGVDEHGQKVKQAAEKRGVSPQAHCDEYCLRFKQLWEKLNIKYDCFMRTTDISHQRIVQAILQKLYDKGDIYSAEYEGWYSVAEERFITDTEHASGQFRDVKKLKEKNYFFKMGQYQDRLIKYINANPDFIQPEHRCNEVLGFLKQPLADLCISRPKSRMDWGIETPFDKDYVTYVWFDALVNYISMIGYGTDDANFNKWWPADVHLIGKDILTTHSVYWTTMLFALDLKIPTIFAHGWWLMGESKMSKSLGNVVSPLDLIEQYGVDAVRYYLMRGMILGEDANFTIENFIKRYNSDLANDFGNLLNRVSGLIGKYSGGEVPETEEDWTDPKQLQELIKKYSGGEVPERPGQEEINYTDAKAIQDYSSDENYIKRFVYENINQFKVSRAIIYIMGIVSMANRYLENQAPWKLVKTDPEAAQKVLYIAAEALRLAAVLLQPVMPTKTQEVLEILGAVGSGPNWGELRPGTALKSHPPLFPRIEVE